jgi:uncharacterized protein
VILLLPPSEGKSAAGTGMPLDLGTLKLSGLAPARERVLDALGELARGPLEAALATLRLTPRQADEVARDGVLRTAPTLPAADRYTGVLYEALDLPGLRRENPAAYEVARGSLLVFSGLWGVVGPDDAIPAYRCAMAASLPGVGPLATHWRAALGRALPGYVGDRLVLDLRSAPYAAAWRPAATRPELAERVVAMRVLHERIVDGVPRRSVVSHFNKATKGRLARALLTHLTAGQAPDDPKRLADLLADLGFRAELTPPDRPGRPYAVDVVVTEV